MKKFRFLSVSFFIFLFNGVQAQHTDVINSNRPGLSMSAFSVGKSVFQIEGGLYGYRENHDIARYNSNGMGMELDLRYGILLEQLEVIANFKYQYDKYYSPLVEQTRSGLRSSLIGAKYLIYDPHKNYEEKPNIFSWKANKKFKWRQLIPAVSAYAGVNIGLANNDYMYQDEPSISPKIMVIAQNQLGTRWVLVTNVFYDKFTSDYKTLGYILTLTRGINEKWSGFIENQGFKSDFYSDGIFRIGAAYLLLDNIQIDASLSKSIKDTPDLFYGGAGVSWRFDKKYQPVKIEKEDDGGKRVDKKKKVKKAKEEKKRLDKVDG